MAEVRPIDANAIVSKIIGINCTDYGRLFDYAAHKAANEALNDAVRLVDDAPTLDYEPVRHGMWVEQEDFCGDIYYTCSACKNDWVCIDGTPAENEMRYCPNCGTKMDGGK